MQWRRVMWNSLPQLFLLILSNHLVELS